MTEITFLVDSGPALNFCATDQQSLLLAVVRTAGTLAAPEAVDLEVRRKAADRTRFRNAETVWCTLVDGQHIEILAASDLVRSKVRLLTNGPTPQPGSRAKDLGETMCIAHALALRELRGADSVVIMDDGAGTRKAGQFKVASLTTERILCQAVKLGAIRSRAELRTIYDFMRRCDDGLIHFSQTTLATTPWPE